ncbi:GAF domain-containing protein [Natronomonas gomsonensis]|uniref:GAF domain-containing protein n=1 Tax=Natronomonas gomsonensis TaxID=1046043 RepID=UPI00227BA9EC|nr:GAF domain-containing protein [Natronomonas gomsonensis]MCY4732609.1 GAF domain-containing protein [Natronomonas gomsonensis]
MSDGDAYTEHTSAGLLELSSELKQTGSIEDASVAAVRMLDLNFDAPLSAIWEFNGEGDELRPITESTEAQEVIGDAPRLPVDSLAGRVYRQGRPEVFDDVHEADGTYNSDTAIRSEILVPISDFGVLSVGATEADTFTEKDAELAKLVASNLEAAISRIRQTTDIRGFQQGQTSS